MAWKRARVLSEMIFLTINAAGLQRGPAKVVGILATRASGGTERREDDHNSRNERASKVTAATVNT